MYAEIIRRTTLFELLHRIDVDLAKTAQAKGCPHCGKRLDNAAYARLPRGGPDDIPEAVCRRLSLCCSAAGCRRRLLPPSCLFFGRRVYWGAVILVVLALRQQRPDGYSARRLQELTQASWRTIKRWMAFYAEVFPSSLQWQALRGKVSATVRDDALPVSLLEAFVALAPDVDVGLQRCLVFLATGAQEHE